MGNRKISICIPNYNRYEMTIESFAQVFDDPRVGEVVICDDCSIDDSHAKLIDYFYGKEKVHFFRNGENQDCYKNKYIAISHATNDWCILLDSDNIIGTDYLDAIYKLDPWMEDTIYQPAFAKPHFDFRAFAGNTYDKHNIKPVLGDDKFTTALNAMNFFVNKGTYLKAFDPNVDPVTSDSIYMAYRLLEQGNSYYFVPGLEYEHRVHSGSHYQNNVSKTPAGFHQEVINKLKAL